MPILVAKVWRQNLDYMYAKNLQAKYFISQNIPIYGSPGVTGFNLAVHMPMYILAQLLILICLVLPY